MSSYQHTQQHRKHQQRGNTSPTMATQWPREAAVVISPLAKMISTVILMMAGIKEKKRRHDIKCRDVIGHNGPTTMESLETQLEDCTKLDEELDSIIEKKEQE